MTRSIATLARDYYELTKPGILKLLVLTTFCTMLVAEGGWPDWGLVFWTVLGTALISGSANTINMVWDTDIDAIMARTRNRPLVRGAMTPRQALVFSGLIGLLAVAILTFFANPLAALMAIAGHAFYVVIYTMWLKRRTPQNIVIGGAAGAFPPLIGWAAVTGDLSVTAWLIFTVIFLWTPPHFWALALYKDIEYGKAGVPMMPVVRGHDVTKYQMLVYTLLLLTVTLALGLTGVLGIIYLVSAVVLGAGFAYVCIRTAFDPSDYWAKRTFGYSIAYLALLFGAMSLDSLQNLHFTETHYLADIERDATRLRSKERIEEIRDRHNSEPTVVAEEPGYVP